MSGRIFIFLVCCMGMFGCKEWYPEPTYPNLIKEYDDPQQMKFYGWKGNAKNRAGPVALEDVMWVVGSDHEGLISQVTNSNRFDSLVVAHGDDHWNRWLQVGGYMFRLTTGLHIVCDRDYDAGHPAGTLLDDLISVYYKGLDDFLVHGEYMLHFVTEQQKRNKWSFYEFEEMLSEFNLKRHKLIGSSFVFRLKKAPAVTGEYVFTCTWTNEDGKKLTASTDPLPIQGEE